MPAIRELVTVLEAQAAELRSLLARLRAEEHAIVGADLPSLIASLGDQQCLVGRLRDLESMRRGIIERLATDLGIDAAELTLSRVLDVVPDAASSLTPLRDEIRTLAASVAAANGRNRFLVGRALAYAERLFTHLVSSLKLAPTPTYRESGRPALGGPAFQLIDREA